MGQSSHFRVLLDPEEEPRAQASLRSHVLINFAPLECQQGGHLLLQGLADGHLKRGCIVSR